MLIINGYFRFCDLCSTFGANAQIVSQSRFRGGNLEKDISALPINTLENVVEGIFDVAACERILHLTEQYISDEARAKGEKMMLEHRRIVDIYT